MIACDTNSLADAAKCFGCLSPETQLQVQTYLLAQIAGGSTDPNTLAAQAKAFQQLPNSTLGEVQAYLLCQIANK